MDKVVALIGRLRLFAHWAMVQQLYKAWSTAETDDLLLRMLLVLATGLSFWVAYGLLKADLAELVPARFEGPRHRAAIRRLR